MANLFTNAVDITPGATGVWVDIDVSAYCPAGTTGVIVQVVNTSASNRAWGLRKPGSTDARIDQAVGLYQTWGYIGVDGNRAVQGYVGGAGLQFKLLGYFTSEGVFFTNGYDKTQTGAAGWKAIDCSAEISAGAKFAIVEMPYGQGLRPVGSTDDRRATYVGYHAFALVGLDANRTFEYYWDPSTGGTIYLVGYLTLGISKTNGVDVSLTSTGIYVNIDRSGDADASGAVGVLVEVYNPATADNYALRKNGGADDFYQKETHSWGIVGLDSNKIFQGKIASTGTDFFVMGYLPVPTYTYTTALSLALTLQSVYGLVQTFTYATNLAFSLSLQSLYSLPQVFIYLTNLSFGLSLQSIYNPVWNYVSSFQVSLLPQSTYFKGWEYVLNLLLNLIPQSDYFAILGRGAIPGPYLLRYPNPRSGQTNVPVGAPIKFIIKSDGPGVDIDTVKVKVTDSWGTNIYDSTSPYFKFSGKKSRYEVEVRPPQPWAYEENAQVEIEGADLNGVPGVVYEYVP